MAIEAQESREGRREKVAFLIEHLLTEMPAYREEAARIPRDRQAQRDFLRALMNVRPPIPLQAEFLRVQDALLTEEREASSTARLCLRWRRSGARLWHAAR